jgi:uncharacterized membrane protein YkoI
MRRYMVAVLALMVLVTTSGCVYNPKNNTQVNQTNQTNQTGQNNTTQNNTSTLITPEEAQNIAQGYIAVPGATAGTPKLINVNGRSIYVVPVMIDGQIAGEIEIDAITGKNLGGAGGGVG